MPKKRTLPTKKCTPLSKLETHLNRKQIFTNAGYFQIDLHPRYSPDGKIIVIDSSHEGLGRQIYLLDISHIIDNPPVIQIKLLFEFKFGVNRYCSEKSTGIRAGEPVLPF